MEAHFNGSSLAFSHDEVRVSWASDDEIRLKLMKIVNYAAGVDGCKAWG